MKGLTAADARNYISEIADAVRGYQARSGGVFPRYLVMDRDAFLACFVNMPRPTIDQRRRGEALVWGCVAVVIDTDGLPMVKAVGGPFEEATR